MKTKSNRKLGPILLIAISVICAPLVEAAKADGTGNGEKYDYVIITTNDIVANSKKLPFFINLKELYGHTVKVVTETDFVPLIGQAPNGRAERIRQWLIDNYQSLGIEYVLLVGNPDPDDPSDPSDSVGDIPMKLCWPHSTYPNNRDCPTDYFYADLTSNWDLDGDLYYGEGLQIDNPASPNPSIGEDTFSARWTGKVICDFTDTYIFTTRSDDGARLYIDGSLVIDNWLEKCWPSDKSVSIPMSAGQHDIMLEFCENGARPRDTSVMLLYWQCSSEGDPHYVEYSIIPEDHFIDATGAVGGLTAIYYDNADFTGTSVTQKDSKINFCWGTGDIGIGGTKDVHAEVNVGRIPVYDNDYAQLDAILQKIIAYETDPGDISWRKTILLPMKPMDADTPSYSVGEGIRNDFALAAGFTCFRIYDEDYAPPTPELWPCTEDNVVNEWKKGYGMVTWVTHGDIYSAAAVFEIGVTNELDDSKPAFTFQASCFNGYPENRANLGYSLLKQGAVATVSSSRISWGITGIWTFQPYNSADHNLAYYYTKKVIQGQPAGVALYSTKGDLPDVDMNAMNYNLYGDPECYLLTTIPNNPPIAEAGGPYEVSEGSPIAFDASDSTDPDGNTLQYRWDFDNDGNWDTIWSNDPTASFTWGDDYTGLGTAKVEVSDGLVGTTDVAMVAVLNAAPTATIDSMTQPNPQFILPIVHTLTFKGSFTDPGWLDTHTAEWNFGDGTIILGTLVEENTQPIATGTTTASHAYSSPGIYMVTLTVTDDDGGVGTHTMQVVVVGDEKAKDTINGYIQNLPNKAFKSNPTQRKKAFANMFAAIDDMLEDEEWKGAIQALRFNIRAKADGFVDGKSVDDWIVSPVKQQEICMMIDDLTAYLEAFL